MCFTPPYTDFSVSAAPGGRLRRGQVVVTEQAKLLASDPLGLGGRPSAPSASPRASPPALTRLLAGRAGTRLVHRAASLPAPSRVAPCAGRLIHWGILQR